MFVPTLTPSVIARFWSFVVRGVADACWLWQGGTSDGYGQFKIGGRQVVAHRVSYLIDRGELPQLLVCHTCDTRGCVNPAHLFVGTHTDNEVDKVAKGRQARGDKHGSRLHPEKRTRGDVHWSRLHPEQVLRGERNGNAKLTDVQRGEIRQRHLAGGISKSALAREYGVSRRCIDRNLKPKEVS